MSSGAQPSLPDPSFDLEPPGTFVYTGPDSTRGARFNTFALSLKSPANRTAFLADEDGYLARYGLTDLECALVRSRDWTGMIQAGGHLLAVLKLAATWGLNLYHVGAHNAGTDYQTMVDACPRQVAGLPDRT